MSTGQKTVFAPHFCESVRFYSLSRFFYAILASLPDRTKIFSRRRLTAQRTHAILTVLTHLIQKEAPMFHLIFLIPVLVVLLLGILLLAVLCSQ